MAQTQGFRLYREEGEAPPPANPDTSGSSGQTHNDVSSAVKFQFGIEDDEMVDADQSTPMLLYQPYKFSRKWGFNVKGPITATVQHLDSGNVEVTFQLSGLPSSYFYLPYQDGETPIKYKGPVEDKTEIMRASELEDIKASGIGAGGAPGGGMGMPPGGGMGMGGPPMGGGMGGGMGGPPMGM